MKSITKIIALVLLITTLFSCEKEQIYDKLLLSKVYRDGELIEVYYYNEKDLIDYVESYYKDEVNYKRVYFYNAANKVIKIESVDNHNEVEYNYEEFYYYNDKGQLTEIVIYNVTHNNINLNIKIAYNPSGEIIADTSFYRNGTINYYRTFELINNRSYKTNFYSYNGKLSGSMTYELDKDVNLKSYHPEFVEPDYCIKSSSSNEIDGNAIFEFEVDLEDDQIGGPISDMMVIPLLFNASYSYNSSGYPSKKYYFSKDYPIEFVTKTYEYTVP